MDTIKERIDDLQAKKILGNANNALKFLIKLNEVNKVERLCSKILKGGKNKGQVKYSIGSENIWDVVIDNWDYDTGLNIIRELFRNTEKFTKGKNANESFDILKKEWEELSLGEIKWPFSQGAFDGFTQGINSEKISNAEKDEKIKVAALKYRRIKELNTLRNDFIETLIFEKNTSILPTLGHKRGVDFFVNSISYDQKVAKSPTKQFKVKYKLNWKEQAILTPALVAKYLYTYQDEGRFGCDSRLLVVYLDVDVTPDRIREIISETNLDKHLTISFTPQRLLNEDIENGEDIHKTVSCFVILLYNK